jgi:hypothetical protein
MIIPRLELNTAMLAVRLAIQVQEEHDIVFGSTINWSDSTMALS